MATNDFQIKSASYGSGESTSRLFKDGTYVVPYRQNCIYRGTLEYTDAMRAAQDLKTIGIYPGIGWTDGKPDHDSNYVIGKMAFTHSTGANSHGKFLYWSVVLSIEPDPLQLMPEIDWQATHYQETVTKNQKAGTPPNAAGTPIVNTAGQPFASAIE